MPNDTTTLHRPRFRLSESGQAFVLRVTEGADTGRTFVCEPSGVLPAYVGQGEGSQLVLTDREVSRRHLRLTIQDGALIVEDLRSKNGTFVNGVGIRAAVLRGGERIRMGVTELLVEAQRATPAEPVLEMAFGRLLGLSQEMRRLYPLFQKLAGSSVPFAIEGEAGTGKELLAEVIHEQGERAERPFVVFDCTAVSANLAESELFGSDGRKGLFELAHTGTLFIDEIADLDLSLQPKLLRAIERGQIRRVGSEKTIEVNVRLIVSSRRDLDREVQSSRFREDLFARLALARVELPPLRQRTGDVPHLIESVCRELGRLPNEISPEQLARWNDAPWFGNVRELRNSVIRYLALGETAPLARGADMTGPARETLESDSTGVHDFVTPILALRLPLAEARRRVVEEFEQRYVEDVLRAHGGHVGRAAAASGIARRHFQRVRGKATKGEGSTGG